MKTGGHNNARFAALMALTAFCCLGLFAVVAVGGPQNGGQEAGQPAQRILGQAENKAEETSRGCTSCHTAMDSATMHPTASFQLGCTDCHGGDPTVTRSAQVQEHSGEYGDLEERAHKVVPRSELHRSANPVRAYTAWMRKSKDYIKFVNPGDLRVAPETCGRAGCHIEEVRRVRTSMMTHGAMLWGAALYNNGDFPLKDPHFGQSYSPEGLPQDLMTWPPPTWKQTHDKGVLPRLTPLERWEVSQPGNVLRVFERGGGQREELGNPAAEEQPGRPDAKLSDRGFGTLVRTDPVFLGLQKTRLFDPLLSFMGTNDHPGDYRSSGCSGCHVVYANDRDPAHSGPYAEYGNRGQGKSKDPMVTGEQSGHPIRHQFTNAIPSSQCMTCHMHPGTNMVATYYGMTWWDNETDGELMYGDGARTGQERANIQRANPEGSALRGRWSEPEFLAEVSGLNPKLKNTQLGDFHGHGWIFRKVYKQD